MQGSELLSCQHCLRCREVTVARTRDSSPEATRFRGRWHRAHLCLGCCFYIYRETGADVKDGSTERPLVTCTRGAEAGWAEEGCKGRGHLQAQGGLPGPQQSTRPAPASGSRAVIHAPRALPQPPSVRTAGPASVLATEGAVGDVILRNVTACRAESQVTGGQPPGADEATLGHLGEPEPQGSATQAPLLSLRLRLPRGSKEDAAGGHCDWDLGLESPPAQSGRPPGNAAHACQREGVEVTPAVLSGKGKSDHCAGRAAAQVTEQGQQGRCGPGPRWPAVRRSHTS